MTKTEISTVGDVLISHYALKGDISRTEVTDEVRNLYRKQQRGPLGDRQEHLAARIHCATGRSVAELFLS
jgi:hypothetical protein